jgi:hypothetical protein
MKHLLLQRPLLWLFCGLFCLTLAAVAMFSQTQRSSGQAPATSSLVTLISDSSTPICPATTVPHTFGDRLFPDGSRKPFTIPVGHMFVITSFDWIVEGSSQPNNTVWTAVTLMGAGSTANALFSGATADSIGRAAGSTLVPNGVAIGSGTTMCMDYVGGATSADARLHGYLQ